MKRNYFTFLFLLFLGIQISNAQKYYTKTGEISFTSQAPLEKIKADNKSVTSVLDIESGRIEFAVLIKSFHFEKALMQEHFNENYMESSKFPKSIFKGSIKNFADINFQEDAEYPVIVEGDMTIHGQTNHIDAEGIIKVRDGEILAESSFEVAVADYKISIPKVVRDNIAKKVEIDVLLSYNPLEQ